jgi:tetratricopeptide (TPR) repeat protein
VQRASSQELLARVQTGGPPDPGVLEALYRGDLAARNWDRAGLWLHLWLESYPDEWPPRLWQAELLERFKKYDRARGDYLRVLELRPDHPRALLGVGLTALANRADYAEAEAYLGRYLARDPAHPEAALGLARCAYGRGDLEAARRGALGVLRAHPGHAGAALLLGQLEAEAGRDMEAVLWLRQAEAGGADRQAVSQQLAQVLRRLGQVGEAEGYHRRFLELREARAAVERAVRAAEREPENADLQYEVGRLTRQAGDEDMAALWFGQALRQDPNHRPSHAALADYYARQSGAGAAARAEWHRRAAAGGVPEVRAK